MCQIYVLLTKKDAQFFAVSPVVTQSANEQQRYSRDIVQRSSR